MEPLEKIRRALAFNLTQYENQCSSKSVISGTGWSIQLC